MTETLIPLAATAFVWMAVSITLIVATCLLYQDKISSAAMALSPAFAQKSSVLPAAFQIKWINFVLLFISSAAMVPHYSVSFFRANPILSGVLKSLQTGFRQ